MNYLKFLENQNNVIIGVSCNIAGSAVMFLTTLFLTNTVEASIYGEFRLLFTFASIVVLALILGRDSLILYLAQKEGGKQKLNGEFFNGIINIIMGMSALWLFSGAIVRIMFADNVTEINYLMSLAMIPLWALFNLSTPFLRVKGLQNTFFLFTLFFQRLVRVPFFFIIVVFFGQGYLELAFSMIFSQIVLLLALWYFCIKNKVFRGSKWIFSFKGYTLNFKYSLNLGFNTLIFVLLTHMSILLLGRFHGGSDVAIFDVVSMLSLFLLYPLTALNKSSESKLTVISSDKDFLEKYKRNLYFGVYIASIIYIIFTIHGEEVLALFGEGYYKGRAALHILIISYLSLSVLGSCSEWLNMNGYARVNSFILIFMVFICFALGVLLIPKYSFVGAALASAISVFLGRAIALVAIFVVKRDVVLLLTVRPFLMVFILVLCSTAFPLKGGGYFVSTVYLILVTLIFYVLFKCRWVKDATS